MITKTIHRVRCVLASNDRYLLVLHNNRLPENYGKWGLPGGVLENDEEPTTGLRRELDEEFRIAVGDVVLLGDWKYRDEVHRVFGAQFDGSIRHYDANEVLDIAWATYDAVVSLEEAGKLHTGFELGAIREYRQQRSC